MAKTARKNRARNARRAKRALRAAMRGEGVAPARRDPIVDGMFHRYKNTTLTMGDARKKASKTACRGKVRYD